MGVGIQLLAFSLAIAQFDSVAPLPGRFFTFFFFFWAVSSSNLSHYPRVRNVLLDSDDIRDCTVVIRAGMSLYIERGNNLCRNQLHTYCQAVESKSQETERPVPCHRQSSRGVCCAAMAVTRGDLTWTACLPPDCRPYSSPNPDHHLYPWALTLGPALHPKIRLGERRWAGLG